MAMGTFGVPDTFGEQVALGLVPGVKRVAKFGANLDIDTTSTPEDVWGPGGVYTGFPAAVEAVEVFSSSVEDDPDKGGAVAGTGAHTIRLSVLRSATSKQYETVDVTLNGTTAVDVDGGATFWRINRAWVLTAGTGQTNAGIITIRQKTTTTNIFVAMPAGYGQTTIAQWSVPYDNTLFITSFDCFISSATGTGTNAVLTLDQYQWDAGVWRIVEIISLSTEIQDNRIIPIPITGGTDIRMRIRTVGANNTTVSAGFGGYYMENDTLRAMGGQPA